MTTLLINLLTLSGGGLIIAALFLFIKRELHGYMSKNLVLRNRISLSELFASLEIALNTEMTLFENGIIRNSDQSIATVNSAEFKNLYNALAMNCMKAISPNFWDMVEVYMTRESVQTYITERCMQFLLNKRKEDENEI